MPARLVPIAVGRTAGAVSGLAESGLVHRLTRGRLWIGALMTLLVGIVALNVMALSFNASSSRATRQTDVLNRQISTLRARIAAAGISNEHVQSQASRLGMVVPQPDSIGYLNVSRENASTAAKRLRSGQVTLGTPVSDSPATATSTTTTTEPGLTTVPGTTP
jgi:transcription elongation GreA/GreB family factor